MKTLSRKIFIKSSVSAWLLASLKPSPLVAQTSMDAPSLSFLPDGPLDPIADYLSKTPDALSSLSPEGGRYQIIGWHHRHDNAIVGELSLKHIGIKHIQYIHSWDNSHYSGLCSEDKLTETFKLKSPRNKRGWNQPTQRTLEKKSSTQWNDSSLGTLSADRNVHCLYEFLSTPNRVAEIAKGRETFSFYTPVFGWCHEQSLVRDERGITLPPGWTSYLQYGKSLTPTHYLLNDDGAVVATTHLFISYISA